MDALTYVLALLVTLGVVVTFHEFGHFWVARRMGVKVLRFSVGFGSPLLKWRDRQGTEYWLAVLPLGGYVKMLDEREGEVAPEELHQAFNRKSVWRRIAIVAAGPVANLLLAILVYWAIFAGGVSGPAPVVDAVAPGSIAAEAGLEPGMEIVAVDGEVTPTWRELHHQLLGRLGESGTIVFSVLPEAGSQPQQRSLTIDDWLSREEQPDPVAGLGLTLFQPSIEPVVAEVTADSPAAAAGLQPGDRLLRADGQPLPDWRDWVAYVQARPGEGIQLTYQRDGITEDTTVVPAPLTLDNGETIGRVGVSARGGEWPEEMIREFHYGPLGSLWQAGRETVATAELVLVSLAKLVTGQISVKNLSGPVTIAKVAGASAKSGVSTFVGFLAYFSIMLGILNLLPIPVLDGGHLLFYAVEAVKGSPVSERIQVIGYQVGLLLIVGVMLLALYNDLMRL